MHLATITLIYSYIEFTIHAKSIARRFFVNFQNAASFTLSSAPELSVMTSIQKTTSSQASHGNSMVVYGSATKPDLRVQNL
jgi:hypothetical protein